MKALASISNLCFHFFLADTYEKRVFPSSMPRMDESCQHQNKYFYIVFELKDLMLNFLRFLNLKMNTKDSRFIVAEKHPSKCYYFENPYSSIQTAPQLSVAFKTKYE